MIAETKPTIYLSNWASHKSPGMHGPGRKWTIMASPRHFERGVGQVPWLEPSIAYLFAYRNGVMDIAGYTRLFLMGIDKTQMPPGILTAYPPEAETDSSKRVLVEDGDTLNCACSRTKAAKGECHRAWCAPLLHDAGWQVILDGKEFVPSAIGLE